MGRDFPPVQTGPGAHSASCTIGTGSFPGVKYGRGVLLTTHPLLVPRSWKSRAIPLPTLWATIGPVTGTVYRYLFCVYNNLCPFLEICLFMYCIFWACDIVIKSAFYLQHVRLDACISAAPAGRISVRLDIGDSYEYLSRNFPNLVKIRYFARRLESFIYILLATLNRHKRAFFEWNCQGVRIAEEV